MKRKNLPDKEVKKLIEQAKAITIPKEPDQLEQKDYDGPENKTKDEDDDPEKIKLKEKELYPKLDEYLKSKFQLYCKSIDEKTSKNINGKGHNYWLHPDIVAMETLDKHWNESTKNYAKQSGEQIVNLWSFEVKIKLKRSNVRECFFQALSNSKWANKGYLVAAHIDDNVKQELKMLSALYGIGAIELNEENPFKSEIIFEAEYRDKTHRESINRLSDENGDFKKYMEEVAFYIPTGRIDDSFWKVVNPNEVVSPLGGNPP